MTTRGPFHLAWRLGSRSTPAVGSTLPAGRLRQAQAMQRRDRLARLMKVTQLAEDATLDFLVLDLDDFDRSALTGYLGAQYHHVGFACDARAAGSSALFTDRLVPLAEGDDDGPVTATDVVVWADPAAASRQASRPRPRLGAWRWGKVFLELTVSRWSGADAGADAADLLTEIAVDTDVDGFLLGLPPSSDALDLAASFAQHTVPELRRRGLVRQEYRHHHALETLNEF